MLEIRDLWLHAHNMIRSGRQMINIKLRPLGLTSAQGNVLLHLLTQGREMGQEQLVRQLDISKPAVSRVLDSLEKKGYVVRQRDPFWSRQQMPNLFWNDPTATTHLSSYRRTKFRPSSRPTSDTPTANLQKEHAHT